jgi:PDZ domain-containing secreted protein
LHIPAKKRPSSPARFCPILEMAAQCGVLKVGQTTVAIDGTKVLAKAEQADSTTLQDGLTIPYEVQRREERQAALRRAKVKMEARAFT